MKKLFTITLAMMLLLTCLVGCSSEKEETKKTAEDYALQMADNYYEFLDEISNNHCTIEHFDAVAEKVETSGKTTTVEGVVTGAALYATADVAPFTAYFTVVLQEESNGSFTVLSANFDIPDGARY